MQVFKNQHCSGGVLAFSTTISNFLTYTSGSITGSVEVLRKTSLLSSIGAPSTAFTIWDFYTLMGPGAKPGETVEFRAAIDYPEITTSVIFPQVFSSATLVTSLFTTLVEIVHTLLLGSATPVGTPGLPNPTVSPPQATTLTTSAISRPRPTRSTKSTPAPSPSASPATGPELSTKAATMVTTGVCGRDKGAAGNVVSHSVVRYNEANRVVIAYNDRVSVGH